MSIHEQTLKLLNIIYNPLHTNLKHVEIFSFSVSLKIQLQFQNLCSLIASIETQMLF